MDYVPIAQGGDLRRGGSPAPPVARLNSLVGRGLALGIPPSGVRIRHGGTSGVCLRANARLTVTLGATVTVPRR